MHPLAVATGRRVTSISHVSVPHAHPRLLGRGPWGLAGGQLIPAGPEQAGLLHESPTRLLGRAGWPGHHPLMVTEAAQANEPVTPACFSSHVTSLPRTFHGPKQGRGEGGYILLLPWGRVLRLFGTGPRVAWTCGGGGCDRKGSQAHGRGLGARGLPVPAQPPGRDEEESRPSAQPADLTPRASRTQGSGWAGSDAAGSDLGILTLLKAEGSMDGRGGAGRLRDQLGDFESPRRPWGLIWCLVAQVMSPPLLFSGSL